MTENDQGPSPRPWRRNPAWDAYLKTGSFDETPPPILDANGAPVMWTSEWLQVSEADVDLIVAAVNTYATSSTS